MTPSSIGKHAGTGTASDQPAVPEPSYAEHARTLMYLGRIGSLSTLSRKQPGFPFNRQLSGCMSFEDLLTCNSEVAIEHRSH
jgi:hypothetical protein